MPDSRNEHNRVNDLRRVRLAALLALPAMILVIAAADAALKMPEWIAIALLLLFCADLGLILVLNRKIRRAAPQAGPGGASAAVKVPKLSRSILIAACWFALDAFVLQQGLVSIIILLLFLFWMVPSAVKARKESTLARPRAWRAVAYLLAAVAALGVIRLNQRYAERRAEVVAAAVRQYQQKYGRFPVRMEEVTPEFVPSIPLAKYALMFNEFQYFSGGNSHRLVYVVLPPFGRAVYHFESGQWSTLD